MNQTKPKQSHVRGRVRRTLAWLSIGILSVATVMTVNTIGISSRQMSVTPAVPIEIDIDGLSLTMAEFLSVPSYSYHDRDTMSASAFLKLHEILEQHFPNAHQAMERQTFGELSLLYRWPGTDPLSEPVLLMSHLDVVPIEPGSMSQWKYPPPEAKIADGYIWGRGALDVKCGVVAIMAAIDQLAATGFQPEQDLYLAFGHDEEIGGQEGNGKIAEQFLRQGIRFRFVLDEGGAILQNVIPGVASPVAFVAIAEKRYAEMTLLAHGEGGHGSMPGRSAVINLADAVVRIDSQPMPARLPEATATLFDYLASEMPFLQRTVIANRKWFSSVLVRTLAAKPSTGGVVRSTINVTSLNTSTAANQNATTASATINVRLLPGDSIDQVKAHLQQVTSDIRLEHGEPAIECLPGTISSGDQVAPTDCSEFRMIQQTIHEVFPDVVVAPGLTSVSTDSAKYYPVTDKVYRFIPMRLNQSDLTRIHGVDERIGVQNLAEIVQFYVQLIRNTSASRSY